MPCYVWRVLGLTALLSRTFKQLLNAAEAAVMKAPQLGKLFYFTLSFSKCDLTAQQDIAVGAYTQTHVVQK